MLLVSTMRSSRTVIESQSVCARDATAASKKADEALALPFSLCYIRERIILTHSLLFVQLGY
ncbi:MAG: hypothetical protein ACXVAF_18155, partial [Vulcanimicrobiaceae bacterium]